MFEVELVLWFPVCVCVYTFIVIVCPFWGAVNGNPTVQNPE